MNTTLATVEQVPGAETTIDLSHITAYGGRAEACPRPPGPRHPRCPARGRPDAMVALLAGRGRTVGSPTTGRTGPNTPNTAYLQGSWNMDDWMWPDESAGVELLHPGQIETGQRLAREITRPDGSVGSEFTPVWGISVGGTYETYGGIGYSFRTSNGELHPAPSNSRVWAHPQIRPEDLPPHEGRWITHQRFGAHDHKVGVLGDRHFYERTRAIDTFTAPDGRVHRLLRGRSTRQDDRQDPQGRWRCYWVYRWDHGVKWLGPSRESPDLACEQFELIREGRAW